MLSNSQLGFLSSVQCSTPHTPIRVPTPAVLAMHEVEKGRAQVCSQSRKLNEMLTQTSKHKQKPRDLPSMHKTLAQCVEP